MKILSIVSFIFGFFFSSAQTINIEPSIHDEYKVVYLYQHQDSELQKNIEDELARVIDFFGNRLNLITSENSTASSKAPFTINFGYSRAEEKTTDILVLLSGEQNLMTLQIFNSDSVPDFYGLFDCLYSKLIGEQCLNEVISPFEKAVTPFTQEEIESLQKDSLFLILMYSSLHKKQKVRDLFKEMDSAMIEAFKKEFKILPTKFIPPDENGTELRKQFSEWAHFKIVSTSQKINKQQVVMIDDIVFFYKGNPKFKFKVKRINQKTDYVTIARILDRKIEYLSYKLVYNDLDLDS